ncbi:hypothetical protein FI667_g9414, partial [Globisporangium splendens]
MCVDLQINHTVLRRETTMAKLLPAYDERNWRRQRAAAHAPRDEQKTARRAPLLLWRLLLVVIALQVVVWSSQTVALWKDYAMPSPKRLQIPQHQQQAKLRRSNGEYAGGSTFCFPDTLDARAIAYNKQSSAANRLFYTTLQSLDPPFPPPVFENTHRFLCQEETGKQQEWTYCLPIKAKKGGGEDLRCNNADRNDLFKRSTDQQPICYASVLHMILNDVYEELRMLDAKPALLYGTLLGAVRSESIIPHTEDADIGYQLSSSNVIERLKQALWRKGYHVFHHEIPRVCIAPTHPLASKLYDRTTNLVMKNTVPYVDLYKMKRQLFGFGAYWDIEYARRGWEVPNDEFQPYAQVHLLGQVFDTVADPIQYLTMEYGADFRTPLL